jgi:cell division control protein 24
MADPLSLAASVAGLLTISSQIAKFLCDAIPRARSAPSDIRSLSSELGALCEALANIETAVSQNDLSNHPRFPKDHLANVLDSIMKDFILLQTAISETVGNAAESVLTRWGKRVNWISREAEVEAFRNKLEAYKTTLFIVITTASLYVSAHN